MLGAAGVQVEVCPGTLCSLDLSQQLSSFQRAFG
jgi:hypothetical protein